MTRYQLWHRTTYRYSEPVSASHMIAHLALRPTGTQTPVWFTLDVEPLAERYDGTDAFDNPAQHLVVSEPHESLVVVASSGVDLVAPALPPDGVLAEPWEQVAARTGADCSSDGLLARLCRLPSPLVDADADVAAFAESMAPPGRPVGEVVGDLTARIFAEFRFDQAVTDVATSVGEVLAERHGVCQDFAHLTIASLRTLGIGARYVSGYLETIPAPGQPRLVGADASHAWVGAYLPGWGWLDLDPTNGLVQPSRHVTIGWGRDYNDVAPVRGVVFGPPATQELEVAVHMEPIAPALDWGATVTGGLPPPTGR